MADRPGIMFYFDIVDDLEDFTTEEIGELFLAMMNYGRTGEVADFSDRGMRSIWRSMMKYVDRDKDRFEDKISQKRYAGWKSAMKRKGIKDGDLPSFDEWKENPQLYDNWNPDSHSTTVNDRQQPLTTVDGCERSSTNYQLSTINSQQSTINYQLSTVNNQQSDIREGEKRVQGEGNQMATIPVEVSELILAFEYAFQNNLIHEVVAIRDKLYSMGYDPKGNRIDQSNLS